MGLFSSKKEGGILDVIRCDEQDYLIWKWSPSGEPSRKMNAIRYGSRLRVKQGEVAVFVYDSDRGMDFIEGFKDEVLRTANFPVLTSIVGAAFGGSSPFQAEVFFINKAGAITLPFFADNFAVTQPGQDLLAVPLTVKGTMTFNIGDYRRFIDQFQMAAYSMDDLSIQIRGALLRYVKSIVSKAPDQLQIPIVKFPTAMDDISLAIEEKIREPLARDFAINVRRFDLTAITLDTESDAYRQIHAQGLEQAAARTEAFRQSRLNIEASGDVFRENQAESMRIMREETQRRQRLQSEQEFIGAHQLDMQAAVGVTAAESLGQMGASGGFGGGDGFNPGAMMAGMMMGGAVGGSMANMMGGMMQQMNQPQPPAPPAAAVAQYHLSVNGQQTGPYALQQLQQLVQSGQLTRTTYVWKQGMAAWAMASDVPEVAQLFGAVPPPPPPMAPPVPPVPGM